MNGQRTDAAGWAWPSRWRLGSAGGATYGAVLTVGRPDKHDLLRAVLSQRELLYKVRYCFATCRPKASVISWNSVGPQGPAGATGATGAQGPAGVAYDCSAPPEPGIDLAADVHLQIPT